MGNLRSDLRMRQARPKLVKRYVRERYASTLVGETVNIQWYNWAICVGLPFMLVNASTPRPRTSKITSASSPDAFATFTSERHSSTSRRSSNPVVNIKTSPT